jgi:hypothetical protein
MALLRIPFGSACPNDALEKRYFPVHLSRARSHPRDQAGRLHDAVFEPVDRDPHTGPGARSCRECGRGAQRVGSVAFADNSPNSTSEALGLARVSDEKCLELRHL